MYAQTMEQISTKKEERAKAIADARALIDQNPDGVLDATGQESYDAILTRSDELLTVITNLQKIAEGEKWAEETQGRQTDPGDGDQTQDTGGTRTEEVAPEVRAFRSFLLNGMNHMTAEEVQCLRALQADSPTVGGYIVTPQTFINQLIAAKDNMVFMRSKGTVIPVGAAESLGAPSLDADPADPAWTAEIGTASEDSSMAFGKRELTPHQLTKLVKISMKLLRVSVLPVDALVRERLQYKFAVTEEAAYMTGNGAQQPLGIFTANDDGISTGQDVSTDNDTDAPTFDGLQEAKFTLKGKYWEGAEWVFHQDCMKLIVKIKDGDGRYIYNASVRAGEQDMLLNFPINLSEYAPNTFTTGLYVGILGNLKYYWIADATNFQIQRLDELYAVTNQVGFIGRANTDGMPVLEEAFVRVQLG